MYYRLIEINGVRVPATIRWADREHLISRGGLLLKPPTDLPFGMRNEGYALLRFFSGTFTDPTANIGGTASDYRWSAPGELDISDGVGRSSLRFTGRVHGADLLLTSGVEDRFLPSRTHLALAEAPDDPIPDEWRGVLDFGPAFLVTTPGEAPPGRDLLAALQASIERKEPIRRREANERLERAWRGPA